MALLLMLALIVPIATSGKDDNQDDWYPYLEPPSAGKAVVYSFRPTRFGGSRPFYFFDGRKYLHRLKGKNYFRYETEPAEHLFLVTAENKSFIEADLGAGRVYALLSRVCRGAWSARVALQGVTVNSEIWPRCTKLARKKKPRQPDPVYIARWEANKPNDVEKALSGWEAGGKQLGLKLEIDDHIK